jgi:hypothetical protein
MAYFLVELSGRGDCCQRPEILTKGSVNTAEGVRQRTISAGIAKALVRATDWSAPPRSPALPLTGRARHGQTRRPAVGPPYAQAGPLFIQGSLNALWGTRRLHEDFRVSFDKPEQSFALHPLSVCGHDLGSPVRSAAPATARTPLGYGQGRV